MTEPRFMEIWDFDKWMAFRIANRPDHSRNYYRLRSIVRIALWTPMAYISFLAVVYFLGLTVGAWN